MGITNHFYLTVLSSWVQLPSCTWLIYHPENNNPPLPGRSIIIVTTSYLYLTVPSSRGPLPTSVCRLHHPGDHYRSLPDSSIITGNATHRSTCLFHHPGDHCLPLLDNSIIKETTTHFYLTAPLSWGPFTNNHMTTNYFEKIKYY